ncbi:polyserase-2, partial [Petaurus breviceps papuanus]|uniref:polyserase-2 n=1 Tax=Petaurus breviceps papuanus TaxID=3040969 RepID=UPI0036DD978A
PECGRIHPRPRVVGGSEAMPGDWPWQVSLQIEGFHICGGSLITESWVVSAAHCVVENETVSDAEKFAVYLGLHSLRMQDQGQYRNITEILIPDNYTDAELGSDIALLHLSEPANFTEFVQTICLPRANHHFPHGAPCWATGWGNVQQEIFVPEPQVLQEVQLEIIGPSTCQCLLHSSGPYNTTIELLPGMICAGFSEGKKDTCQVRGGWMACLLLHNSVSDPYVPASHFCSWLKVNYIRQKIGPLYDPLETETQSPQGDSGGPLVCEEAGQWFLAGITSFGHGCARRNRPGIFTAVAAYESWIQERVTGASFPEQPQPVAPDMPEEPPNNCTLALPECGSAPQPGHWPWKAIVVTPTSNPCHGVMVSETWVLVPASCFLGLHLDPTDWHVLLPSSAKRIPVLQVLVNRNYTMDHGYDLALLELEVSVNLTEDTRPVCLPSSHHFFLPGSRCHLTQWGPGDVPSIKNALLEAEMMTHWWCYCLHGQEGEEVAKPGMDPRILCADYPEEEMSSCWFGSRWGLLCQESGTWFLAGVSESTESCLRPRVFSPLQLHDHWIRHVTLTNYLEDQLAWNWGTAKTPACPLKTKYGACGLRQAKSENSNPWPWMAEVHGTSGKACIGSLVSHSWVLAATHCVTRQASTTGDLQVYLGTAGFQGHQVSRAVTSIRLPPGMGSRAPLVLLKLETRVESSPSTLPVCLHSGPPPTDISCWVLGWKDSANRVPLAVPVSVLSPEDCRCLYDDTLPSGTICIQYSKETGDRFKMDSGSSLLCEEESGSWVLVGISLKGSQELFAPVGTQEPWISHTVEEAAFLATAKFSPVFHRTARSLCPAELSSAATVPRVAVLFLPLFLLLRF